VSDVVTSSPGPFAHASTAHALVPASTSSLLKDTITLGKPRIAVMAAIVGGGSWLLATPAFDAATVVRGVLGIFGVALIVMGAGALNMFLERDVDALMTRTKNRPLAAQRMSPAWALGVGVVLSSASLPLLLVFGNALTLALGVLSLFLYVMVYTPMKRTSAWSLVVGAVPGAMPALMGATLATGTFETVGVALFAVVFLWQLPHFLAISIYREEEYLAAGHRVFPTSLGIVTTKALILATTAPLSALAVALWPLGLGGPVYAFIAALLGLWFTVISVQGFAKDGDRAADNDWARKAFIASLVWQTLVFGALGADRVLYALFGA
jgi:protoheme IX farnesyltransferase